MDDVASLRPKRFQALLLTVLALTLRATGQAAEPTADTLEKSYGDAVHAIVERYCFECHSGDSPEADLDLSKFATWTDVRKNPRAWQKVREMLSSGQMPPSDADQPSADERSKLEKWVHDYLTIEARDHAGDPGRVVLRRLSNAEYTYTLRDLTGIDTLDPAREFPGDGAAGEGFTNTGSALVMSPALVTKYFDAAKEVAGHAVLLPNGISFSPHTTSRDWTDEALAKIRAFYRQFTDSSGSEQVNLQGVVFDTNQGGRLPVAMYLAATLSERDALNRGETTIDAVAVKYHLNAKYLGTLWTSLNGREPSLLMDTIRARWKNAKPEDAAALAAEIAAWQKGLWTFSTVGHIGKVGGPKRWLVPVSPLVSKQDLRLPIPAAPPEKDVVISLVATDAGDGSENDVIVWQQPRLVLPGRPDLLLRDVRAVARDLTSRRARMFASTEKYLVAADEATTMEGTADPTELARKHGIESAGLSAWLDFLGIGAGKTAELTGHFTDKLTNVSGHAFIQGWGSGDTPEILANSSDEHVRIPGNMKPHSVAVHPSPTLRAVIGWRSPVTAKVRIEGTVTHAHPECGNGIAWALELRRGGVRRRLADGATQGPTVSTIAGLEDVDARPGDVISIVIGSRDGNHSCDLTGIDLKITSTDANGKAWNLADDVSGDILAGNPHKDHLGNEAVWHFYTEPDKGGDNGLTIPAGSLLAKWLLAKEPAQRQELATAVEKLLAGPPPAGDGPDSVLYRQVTSLNGPLFRSAQNYSSTIQSAGNVEPSDETTQTVGLDPTMFGKTPDGHAIDPADLCVKAPATIEVHLPAELVAGCELVATGVLEEKTGAEGSAQLLMVGGKATTQAGLVRSEASVALASGAWTADNRLIANTAPVLVAEKSAARQRIEAAFDEFRSLFPAALCYVQIVPVDEPVTLNLFYREDDHLVRLMLDDVRRAELDGLWDELHFVSRDALTLVDVFEQLMEYATQDADPKVFAPLRGPINERAAAFRQQLKQSEPKQIAALLQFAARVYRRPLTDAETSELQVLYDNLRSEELPHDEALRLTLAKVLVAPAFLYRVEAPPAGTKPGPVSQYELANRLSYFLWSSQPDAELRGLADAGRLAEPDVLIAQMRRMLRDAKTRRLATEFACQWLHIYDFDELDEKSEQRFPDFTSMRGPIYEESIQFFTDFFQNDRSVLDILDADYTFVNEELARYYGIPNVAGPEWRRVDGVKKFARGGILAQATTLAKQSGASRTSPILRGNWVSEVLLGERLPRPPKGVPPLPDDEAATEGLTVRQLVEKHVSDPKCAVCHARIDPYGFALEAFDAVGRHREKDLGDRQIDTRVTALDGAQFDGIDGLRNYLLTSRRDAFVRQFCRKLLGYALGRSVQLSDEPLLEEVHAALESNDYKVISAIEAIVRSPQFREIRGRDAKMDD